ncbi:MAG: DUF1552 domain-containing protein [Acidobacteria bacterium]|nr:DUF1552 domain-containing protein [Acidobacteriota bacterium]
MMIFKKALPRRTFLKTAGATVALPMLGSMMPALARPADATRATRLSFVYMPNGSIMSQWTPKGEGRAYELSPILKPLAPLKDRLLVISGLHNRPAEPLPGESAGGHARPAASYLTGIHLGKTGELGVSADQIAARELGKATQLASLELSLDQRAMVGSNDNADSDAYLNSLSWRSGKTPQPVETNPRAVFERLFGQSESTSAADRKRLIQQNRSILDAMTGDIKRLMNQVSTSDQSQVEEYLDSVREVERGIARAEQTTARELPVVQRPAGIPERYDDYARLMFDLQVLAFRTDMTRVTTFMLGIEKSDRIYREIGVDEAHHALSHHNGNTDMISKMVRIGTFHSEMFQYYLDKLQATPDGDGSLLDHSLVVYGSSMGDGSMHSPKNLPALLAGGGYGQVKGGRHLVFPMDTPHTNFLLTVLNLAGVSQEKFGDSSNKLDLLSLA